MSTSIRESDQMSVRKVALEEAARVRWRNDGGWTREIAMGSAGAGAVDAAGADSDWDWRISVAEIEQDGPFSRFPGIDRCLLLLDGAGMSLRRAGQPDRTVVPSAPRIDFPGEDDVDCRLRDGPTRDLNLMWRRSRLVASIDLVDIDEAMAWTVNPGVIAVVVHVLVGFVTMAGEPLAMTDTLVLTPPFPDRFQAGGKTRLVIASFRSH
ncbi:HutD/Ves family protein [Pseudofulvimonas gallinarii]|uniref:HutD/Ves family protein n=1 Tax=Pseudofulvimonas gallinarii TaxID=634155 RepID=UPI0013DD8AEC|nr:HutD family protein [Pseudofulvimonas gallinarii]